MNEYMLALTGGILIGLAAVLLMASTGHIMGVSGIASRVLPPLGSDWMWKLTFLVGVLLTPVLLIALTGSTPSVVITSSPLLLIVGGLLVGFGSVYGNGCTSGHGVCGLSRLSVRSLVATGVFMFFAAVTVYIARHVLGA